MEGIGAIPVFVAVVENGGFAAAARKLGVSKSAVSKRVSQVESRLGVLLLHRSTRRLSLTEAGERYFAHAVEALAAAREAEDAVAQLQSAPQGRLRINTPMSFGRLHIAPLIPAFLKRYPGIEIDMVMEDRVVDLIEGGFDVAIRAGSLPDSALIARKLAPCYNVLCAAPEYIAESGGPSKPSDLLDHNCLHYAYSSDAQEWVFQGHDAATKIQTRGNYHVNNSEALREAVIGGCGIGRLPTFIAGPDIAAGRLVRLLEEYPMPSQIFYAVFPERRHLPAKVRVFVDYAVERFGAERPYWDEGLEALY
ncbi:LysR family transcriptional regulator [Pelagibius sp. Alg239-R121]|uniref:LysR family transcriptional regulator n=1 Tax=Pelagibius sp. Alg239-R121 TaxID=2993448 RepID=UPI0024A65BEF|nr:LysR family transcriptional regulator [Pelagibius sp. Alg239-R121]